MSEPIRILMINYKMQCAGIEAFIMNVYRNIDRNKIQFDFLVHYKEPQYYDNEIVKLGGKIYRLSVREDNNFVKYFNDLKFFFDTHKEYKIVHGHMESFGVFYFKAAETGGVPVRIAHSHIAQKNSGLKGIIKDILNKGFALYATDLFACSDSAGKFVFGDNAKYTVFNNAIDVDLFRYNTIVREAVRQELGILDNQFVIGHVGRFNTQKNHTFLIDIFSEIHHKDPTAILLLIGEGDLEKEINDKVLLLGLSNVVRFLGVRRDVNRLYQAMDLFLMPSLFEGLPVSGIEAQAAGLKCVFSDTVTERTAVTENVEFISLKTSASDWAKTILRWREGYVREDTSGELIGSGYDIKVQARNLQSFYLKEINRSNSITLEDN